MVTHNKIANALCRCLKNGYSNGQKAKFSGSMGHWIEGNDDRIQWWFAYKQPKVVDLKNFVARNPQYTKLYNLQQFNKLNRIAIKVDAYSYPMFSYFCAFMVISIRQYYNNPNKYFLTWASGDDDIGYHLDDLSESDIPKVKKFILENHKSKDFDFEFQKFIAENNYSYY